MSRYEIKKQDVVELNDETLDGIAGGRTPVVLTIHHRKNTQPGRNKRRDANKANGE